MMKVSLSVFVGLVNGSYFSLSSYLRDYFNVSIFPFLLEKPTGGRLSMMFSRSAFLLLEGLILGFESILDFVVSFLMVSIPLVLVLILLVITEES